MRSARQPPPAEREQIEALLGERLAAPVELLAFSERPASRLYRYRVALPDPMRIVVKVPLLRDAATPSGDRPRRSPPTPPERKAILEFAALESAERHFVALDDARFAAVHPVALLQPMQALVMREVAGTSLRESVKRALLRWRAPAATLEAAVRTGAWLRAYHAIAAPAGVEQRLASGDAIADLALAIGAYLENAPFGREAAQLAGRTAATAGSLRTEDLPLAVVHGDFAMRNVLVADGRVAVIDMLGRWRAPAYEDVVTMTGALDTIALSAGVGGILPLPPAIQSLRRAFLEGYFGDVSAVPAAPLGVLGALFALEQLAAIHARGPVRGLVARGLLRIAKRSLDDGG